MTRLPVILSFLLFLGLAATLAYWIPQWMAPAPRAVSSPPKSERAQPPVSAAVSLFGGRAQGPAMANVQLRGVVHSGRASDSVAIIAVEGKPPRALRVNSDIAPGMKVKQILNKTVVVSEQGAERELSLPMFTAQESSVTAQAATSVTTNVPQANAPAVVSPGPASSGAQGNAQGNSMAVPPERLRIPTQSLPGTTTNSAGPVPPSR